MVEESENVDVAKLIHRGGVFKNVKGSSPEAIYEQISKMIDLPDGMTSEFVYNALCAREQVLSTAVGNGIALPHARSPIMKDEEEQRICVVYLSEPLDMKAPDERPVSTMFILLTHNSQVHLKVLSALAGYFRSARFRKALEVQADEAVLFNLIHELDA
ncbi:MAG: PTS sugar transporter subunit IIA [Treponema sp.]|nr:PTS sugar transporter subunit IIA [Treponema sp.]